MDSYVAAMASGVPGYAQHMHREEEWALQGPHSRGGTPAEKELRRVMFSQVQLGREIDKKLEQHKKVKEEADKLGENGLRFILRFNLHRRLSI